LDLVLMAADPVCFVPVEFDEAYRTVPEAYPGDALAFPPATEPVRSAKAWKLSDSAPLCDSLDLAERLEYAEIHDSIYAVARVGLTPWAGMPRTRSASRPVWRTIACRALPLAATK